MAKAPGSTGSEFPSSGGVSQTEVQNVAGTTDTNTGTITTDGTEQTVLTIDPADDGYGLWAIDLTGMTAGDTVVIRQKTDIDGDGTYSTVRKESYDGQDGTDEVIDEAARPVPPVITPDASTQLVPIGSPIRVTIERTAGGDNTYDFMEGIKH